MWEHVKLKTKNKSKIKEALQIHFYKYSLLWQVISSHVSCKNLMDTQSYQFISNMFENEILDLDKVKWPLTSGLRGEKHILKLYENLETFLYFKFGSLFIWINV